MKLAHSESREAELGAQLRQATDHGNTPRLVVTEQGLEVIEDSLPAPEQDRQATREEELSNTRKVWAEELETITPGTGSTLFSEGETAATDTELDKVNEENDDFAQREYGLPIAKI